MATIKDILKFWAKEYETADFIKFDPIQIPHRYTVKQDIEISAFVTSWLSWGNREQIIKKADFVDKCLFNGRPYDYILNFNPSFKDEDKILYRTFRYKDFYKLCERLRYIYRLYPDMETAMDSSYPLDALQYYFHDVNGVPNEDTRSACKRLNMFLRWVVRKESPVDFGVWGTISPSSLIIPVDTHVLQEALKLGLTKRKKADIITAKEITSELNEVFPGDPCKGDFALFGFGVNSKKQNDVISVSKLKIEDVLKMEMFYVHVSNILKELKTIRKERYITLNGKASPIDPFIDMNVNDFISLYTDVINKISRGYSSNERTIIKQIGDEAFNKTIKTLILDEKERNMRNRSY